MIECRPATAADFRTFYGNDSRPTSRAIAALVDGQVQAIVGLARRSGYLMLFSDYAPEFRPHMSRMVCLRAIRQVLSWIEEKGTPVYAVAHPDEPLSPLLLVRMGFGHFCSSDLGEIYRWQV